MHTLPCRCKPTCTNKIHQLPTHAQDLCGVLAQSHALCAVGRRGGSNNREAGTSRPALLLAPDIPLVLIINQLLLDQGADWLTYKE